MIDAHQHFWRLDRGDYGWLTPDLGVLYRDFGPEDLAPLLESAGIDRTVLVQAAPTVAESRFLLSLARQTSSIAGVVGWVDLAADGVGDVLDELLSLGPLRGVRPMIQDIPDPDWMLLPTLGPGLEALQSRGLCFDALVKPLHLPRLAQLIERHPELPVVIDHAGKPGIASGDFEPWAADIRRIAESSDVHCKLSGLVTEAAPDWDDDALCRTVDWLLECFGPERLMWGSDWPVVETAGGFTRWRDASLRLLAELDDTEQSAVLGRTAERFYRLA